MIDIFEIEDNIEFHHEINISTSFDDYSSESMHFLKCELDDDVNTYNYNFFFHQFNDSEQREYFYLKAIRNLVKQRDFLFLTNQFDNNLIDEEMFSKEIEENQHKYTIDVNENLDIEKIRVLSSIIEKLNIELHDSDMSEIFSINTFGNHLIIKNKVEG